MSCERDRMAREADRISREAIRAGPAMKRPVYDEARPIPPGPIRPDFAEADRRFAQLDEWDRHLAEPLTVVAPRTRTTTTITTTEQTTVCIVEEF